LWISRKSCIAHATAQESFQRHALFSLRSSAQALLGVGGQNAGNPESLDFFWSDSASTGLNCGHLHRQNHDNPLELGVPGKFLRPQFLGKYRSIPMWHHGIIVSNVSNWWARSDFRLSNICLLSDMLSMIETGRWARKRQSTRVKACFCWSPMKLIHINIYIYIHEIKIDKHVSRVAPFSKLLTYVLSMFTHTARSKLSSRGEGVGFWEPGRSKRFGEIGPGNCYRSIPTIVLLLLSREWNGGMGWLLLVWIIPSFPTKHQ